MNGDPINGDLAGHEAGNGGAQPHLLTAESTAAIAHINLLQGIINRLANNSASCKTWCITLVAAVLSLAGSAHNPAIVAIALVPVVVFGIIDTTYLAHEKAYRDLYERMAEKMRAGTYSLDDAFDADASTTFLGFCLLFIRAFISWSVLPIYVGLVAAYFVARCTKALVWLTT